MRRTAPNRLIGDQGETLIASTVGKDPVQVTQGGTPVKADGTKPLMLRTVS